MAGIGIKFCGLKSPAIIDEAIRLNATHVGLVHFPASPRHVTLQQAAKLASHASGKAKSVVVTVDPDDTLLEQINAVVKPDYVQLHGKESPERVREIKAKHGIGIIKALKVSESDDVAKANAYADTADMLLFDARPPVGMLPGGNGLAFDWRLLSGRDFGIPWFLSGGLNAENVAEAIRISGARMVDVSSSIESDPGEKDVKLMQAFADAACKAGTNA